MRITEIAVEGLFGLFTHRVELCDRPRITIVHGPNGVGKTALLTMTRAACAGDWGVLRGMPFKEFTLSFDDNRRLQVKRATDGAKPVESYPLRVRLLGSNKPVIEIPGIPSMTDLPLLPALIEDLAPELDQVGPSSWRNRRTSAVLDWPQVFDRYGAALGLAPAAEEYLKPWLAELQHGLSVRLISTDRLWNSRPPMRAMRSRAREPRRANGASVRMYSADLSVRIRETLAVYAERSQQLERTFSKRLLSEIARAKRVNLGSVITAINAVEAKRSRLMKAGLLDNEEDFSPIGASQVLTEPVLKILRLYAEDGREKLSVFDELLERVELLIRLVDSKFLANRFSVGKDGFEVTAGSGQPLPIENLSSGEQHEVVLTYELLFLTPADSLVLIDEPELSLDIAWQRDFTSDLVGITELGGFDVMIATHSPQVVGRYRNQLVELHV